MTETTVTVGTTNAKANTTMMNEAVTSVRLTCGESIDPCLRRLHRTIAGSHTRGTTNMPPLIAMDPSLQLQVLTSGVARQSQLNEISTERPTGNTCRPPIALLCSMLIII